MNRYFQFKLKHTIYISQETSQLKKIIMIYLCWICSDKSRHLLNKMLGGKIDPRWEEHSKCGRDFPSIPCILPPLFLLCLEPDVLPPFDHLVQLLCSLFSNLPFHHFPSNSGQHLIISGQGLISREKKTILPN